MNKSITIDFSIADITDEYWIRLEQVEFEDEATLGEIAELVDAVFEIDPCIKPEDEEEPETEPETEDTPWAPEETVASEVLSDLFIDNASFQRLVKDHFVMDFCNLTGDNNYVAQVKVILSTPGEDYVLRLDNGIELGTVRTEENISDHIEVENATSVKLEYPVTGDGKFEWGASSTSKPTIIRTGNTLSWGTTMVTGSIAVRYPTQYDLVDILVYCDEEGEPGVCKIVGFYHGMVDELETKAPDQEGSDDIDHDDYCGLQTHWEFPPYTPGLPQWITFETMYYCKCSGAYDHSKYTHEPTLADMTKDPPTHIFPGITRVEDGGFIDCGENDGDINDPAFYEEVCCHPPEINLPQCVTIHAKNGGKKLDPDVQKSLIAQYGDRLQVTYLMPNDGDCGTNTFHQKMTYKNCCEEVIPMEWNDEMSIETINYIGSGWLFASGGEGPYTWVVHGKGFFFSGGVKQIVTDVPSAILVADYACGPGFITVTDVCEQYAQGTVRSSNGTWVYQGEGADAVANVVCGRGTWFVGGITFRYEIMVGHQKTDQSYTHRFWQAPPTYIWGNWCGICGGQINCPELDPIEEKCTRCVTGAGLDQFPYPCGEDDNYSDVPCTWENPPEDGFVDMYDIQPGGVNVHVWECLE